MIENNPSNVSAAFEMLLEEIEAEVDFINRIDARAFESRDYEKAQEALEREIDQIVYRLYGLSLDEIKIVEENTRR